MPGASPAAPPTSAFFVDTATLHEMVADVDHGVDILKSLGGVKGLAKKLKTSINKGLSVSTDKDKAAAAVDVQHQQRIDAFGENVLPEEEESTFWDFVMESLEDRMLQILIVSAVISLALGLLVPSPETGEVDYAHGWVDGAAILLTVCLVTAVGSINNYQKELKFKELSAKKPPKKVKVLRNGGVEEEILDSELLTGDVLLVSGGDVLDVDGVVIRATQLKMDESAATGENDDVAKVAYDDISSEDGASGSTSGHPRRHADCLVRSGTNVVEGEGTILVTGVGIHSFAGKIAMEVRREKEETPLQEKLTVLADQIGYLGMAAAFLMFTILSAKESYDTLVKRTHPFDYKKYLDNLMTAVTIVVVAVPEGLPLSVTIALAYGMKQMFKENNLVRHLAACETMGGATAICTDKTGTLTQNEMTVTDGFLADGTHFIVPLASSRASAGLSEDEATPAHLSPNTAAAHESDKTAKAFSDVFPSSQPGASDRLRELFMEAIAMNTKCERRTVPSSPTSKSNTGATTTKLYGNKTEQALLGFVERLGEDPFAIRARLLEKIQDVVHVYPHGQKTAAAAGAAAASEHAPTLSGDLTSSSGTGSPSASPQPQGDTAATMMGSATAPVSQKELRVYPFTSARKRMTTAFVLRSGKQRHGVDGGAGGGDESHDGVVRYHVKGASEVLLRQCSKHVDAAGNTVDMTPATRAALEKAILSLARRRLRTLALAYAEAPLSRQTSSRSAVGQEDDEKEDAAQPQQGTTRGRWVLTKTGSSGGGKFSVEAFSFPEVDSEENLPPLVFLGLMGIRDPVRPEVPAAIARCRHAGVTVRMITGDNKATAVAIAREVGIYGPVWFSDRPCYRGGEPGSGVVAGEQGLALEGRQFREMARSERTLNAILPKLQVISRASPLDKQILVAALMKRGEVVAVTGDGTNDAPALKNASVGFSMNSGTEVAKTASDVVILDDNFTTIVTAMKWGRNVHDNICKFLQFQMTVNVAAVVVSFIGSLTDAANESPLKPVQLLWVNLIMDTLAALALATESPAESVLDRPPKPKNAPLISRRMWANILGQSLYQVALQLWLLQRGHEFFGVAFHSEQHLSAVFNVFVLLQLFNEFNARILDTSVSILQGIHRAPLFLLVVGTCFLVQVFGVQYGGTLMRAAPLTWPMWRQCLQLSVVPIPLGIVLRVLVPVTEKPVPPPQIVVDPVEEQQYWEAQQEKQRPTLKEAARKVLWELKIVKLFKHAKKADFA